MRKIYLTLFVIVIGLISVFIFKNINTDKNLSNKEFTPREIWQQEFNKKKEKRKKGYSKADKPDMFTQYFKGITTEIGSNVSGYKMNYKTIELNKALQNLKSKKGLKAAPLPWIQRGPANVGGRTRAIIIDPDDATHQTWFASAATGGIWKTTDGGNTWSHLSESFSNLAINALAMAESNHNVIYAGTGESFPGGTYLKGNGIWKSVDKGLNWTQLSSTINENFAYVNRLIVDPADANIVIAATSKGILKSTDGGSSWTEVHFSNTGVEDIVADPTTFNTIIAGENSIGILRSTDAGNTWTISSNGLGAGDRYEVDFSPVNHNNVFTSVNVSSTVSNVYFSEDNGINWKKFNDTQNFLGGQGEYDNIIAAHPYNADEAFIGGVDVWKVKFNGTETTSAPQVLTVYSENTSFLSFVNYGGAYLGGGMSDDNGTSLSPSDWVSIEVRFGTGLTQKAHRFYVPDGATSGVAATSYTYQDYVDVPFQVWDITNNKQLMVSFRDQERDGEFNLYKRIGENYGELGREYIYINAVEYNATTADANIAVTGGHAYKALYMIWPTLAEGETWTPATLPTSKIVANYGTITLKAGVKTSIADSYGNYGGPNGYDQGTGFGTTEIPGLHPDHHSINIIPTGSGNFIWVDGNDGGIGVSYDNGTTLDQIPTNYITTQFYGVAKNPQANEYIGGMQDNGTWQSAVGEEASSTSDYFFRIGGDGFECLWHATDPNLMLGSVYNNSIRRSANKGSSWAYPSGITSGDGPFITRLSASKENPDMVFAVGGTGIYKSINFGSTWTKKSILTNWVNANGVTSSHNIEVSLANGKIVWAGGGMATSNGLQVQVSSNYGESFTAVPNYSTVDMNAYTSGIATHPTDPNTAYVLFSLSEKPKVLRTTDLGQTWTDISGFGTGTVSTNGFPDVVTHCLLVMPYDANTIWVGTDIGLFESTDNGTTWHIADNGLPPVSVYDMQIVGNQVVIATHGRGIWSVDIAEIDNATFISSFIGVGQLNTEVNTNLNVAYDKVELYINDVLESTLTAPATGITDIPYVAPSEGDYNAYIIGYIGANQYKSNSIDLKLDLTGFASNENIETNFNIYPNPSNGFINFDIDLKHTKYIIEVYNTKGQKVYSANKANNGKNYVNLQYLDNGLYIININIGNEKISRRLHIEK
ncbi:MAG: T9SS type A sorting domain-containing protein [Bacteroidales bacterium]|nr:T9SS type A sorting domain-containing protein [Bacteroidales bacterium]